MRNSWGKNFRTKDEREVALTSFSRCSETQSQWRDVRAAADSEMPARMKTLTIGGQYGSESRKSAAKTHSTVREISRGQAFLCQLLSASLKKHLQLTCFKKRRTCTRADWGELHRSRRRSRRNVFDSLWDFFTTFRRRRNLFSFRFRLQIFRRRVGIFSHFFICCFFFFKVHVSLVSIGTRWNNK